MIRATRIVALVRGKQVASKDLTFVPYWAEFMRLTERLTHRDARKASLAALARAQRLLRGAGTTRAHHLEVYRSTRPASMSSSSFPQRETQQDEGAPHWASNPSPRNSRSGCAAALSYAKPLIRVPQRASTPCARQEPLCVTPGAMRVQA